MRSAAQVLAVLDSGRDAAFLTLGDSTLYSTFFYLLEALRRQQPGIEVGDGAGHHLFQRRGVAAQPGPDDGAGGPGGGAGHPWRRYLRQVLSTFENVVLLKVAPVLTEVQALLAELGRLDDAAYVCRCGMDGQVIRDTLAGAGELPGDYYSLILVRHAAREF